MLNGSPTDNNAVLFKKGAHSVIDTSGYRLLAEYDTPAWDPAKAQDWVTGPDHAVRRPHRRRSTPPTTCSAGARHRVAESGGCQPAAAGDRPGRRARRGAADPRRRPVHDGLQGDPAGSGEGGPARRRAHPLRTSAGRHDGRVGARRSRRSCSASTAVTADNVEGTVVKDKFYGPDDGRQDLRRRLQGRLRQARNRIGRDTVTMESPPSQKPRTHASPCSRCAASRNGSAPCRR